MPELPEVETVRIGLQKLVVGQQVVDVVYDWPKSFPNAKADVDAFLVGSTITSIVRRGKALILALDTEYSLVIHLKMTGQLVFRGQSEKDRFGAGHPSDSLIGKLPDNSTRVTFTFKTGDKLFFNDQRKFGWVRLLPSIEVENIDFFKKMGPEPLASSFSASDFTARLERRKNSGIKAVLLDQTVVAGVGNIYADESLFAAKIHPKTLVKDIPSTKKTLLFKELQDVLRLSIEKGGSTDRNYVNVEGKKGSYIDFAQVFRREGLPCNRCGSIIEKHKIAGRGTHVCPSCQREPSKQS